MNKINEIISKTQKRLNGTYKPMSVLVKKDKNNQFTVWIEDCKSNEYVLTLSSDSNNKEAIFNDKFDDLNIDDKIIVTDVAYDFEHFGLGII